MSELSGKKLKNKGKVYIYDDVVIANGLRTPFGKFNGSYSKYSASELGTNVSKELMKASVLSNDEIDQVIFANTIPSSTDSIFLEPIIAEHIKLNRFKEVLFAGSEKTRNLLLKYYIDIIRRKVLLAHGHSVIGVYMAMLIAYCITRWYSKALVIVEGNSYSEVEDFHSELAVRVTERYYIGHNVKFMEPFRLHSRYILIKWFISI